MRKFECSKIKSDTFWEAKNDQNETKGIDKQVYVAEVNTWLNLKVDLLSY